MHCYIDETEKNVVVFHNDRSITIIIVSQLRERARTMQRPTHTRSIRSQPTVHRRIVGNVTQAKRFTGINCYVSNEIKFGWPYNSTPLFYFVFCHMMQKHNNDEQTLKCFGWFFSYDPRFFKNLNIPHIRIGKSVFAFQSNIKNGMKKSVRIKLLSMFMEFQRCVSRNASSAWSELHRNV